MTQDEIREVCEELKDDIGETTVGYIGNLRSTYDDRMWYVWLHDWSRVLDPLGNTPSVCLGRTDWMREMTKTQLAFMFGKRHGQLAKLQHKVFTTLGKRGYTNKQVSAFLHSTSNANARAKRHTLGWK